MSNAYHYPPELLALLVDVIPLLCRSKHDVLVFFRGAGVPSGDIASLASRFQADPASVNKFQITREILEAINKRGDSGLAARREVIKRVVEFDDFSTCWPGDQLKARGLVSQIRDVVNVKDSFTRMKQERDKEREAEQRRRREQQAEHADRKAQREDVRRRLFSLFAMNDEPNARGKLLEGVLNDLFRAYGILVRENFRRQDLDDSSVLEQIDGVIVLDGVIHLPNYPRI